MGFAREHDFEAKVHFLMPSEGGRRVVPSRGYRSDMRYSDYPEDKSVWMVWPLEFFTDEGDLAEGEPAPRDVYARFWILDSEVRETIHRPRLKPGVAIELVEGTHLVGRGVVTKLVSLAKGADSLGAS